ncbi:MAG: hypothetical protein GY719_04045 [bacterium]|nr:hypothetical protein [bacterium]
MTLNRGSALVSIALALVLAAPAAQAAEHFVAVNTANLAFEPADLTIQVGDTVTWTNDGGFHNVVADDGSFTSGEPSMDMWVYSYTFHEGGTFPYDCEVHVDLGMTGAVTVEGIFADGVDDGNTDEWSSTIGFRSTCVCYFSSDCAGATFCDYGPGGFSTEDICTWVDGKPEGNPGTACDLPHIGAWGGPICDGLCAAAERGSQIGLEDPELVAQGARLWAEALLQPAEAGGGPPDQALVDQALAIEFQSPAINMNLGRQINDVLILAGSPGFYEHFCHYEQHPDEPETDLWVDLSQDACRAAAARLAVEAVLAELAEPGSGASFVDQIAEACEDSRHLFGARCPVGPDTMECVKQRLRETAVFLTTPSDQGAAAEAGALLGPSLPWAR